MYIIYGNVLSQYVHYTRSLLILFCCRQLSVKEVKPIESMPATTAAVNNTSNVDVVPPLQPSPAKKVVPPRKSASVHAFSASKPPLVKTVNDICNYSNIAVRYNGV